MTITETDRGKYSGNKILYYYLVLLLLVVFRTSTDEPNALIRYGFLGAFFAPLILKYRYLFPACLITFMTIGTYGFAFNFFPYDMGMYVVIALIGLVLSFHKTNYTCNFLYIFALVYSIIISLISSYTLNNFIFSFATTILMVYYLGSNSNLNKKLLLNSFSIASICLSGIYLLNYQKFLVTYEQFDNVQRSGWTDPNYLSCIIGMGIVTSLYQLLKAESPKFYEKLFWIATIAGSFIAQVLMASRGGIIAVAVPCLLLVFLTKTKLMYKLLIAAGLVLFVMWLFKNDYFELLSYRIEHDDGSGSGRTEIWERKLSDFTLLSPLQQIFGIGYERSLKLGEFSHGVAFHNDFIAILCQYGVIGLFGFVYFLIHPLVKIQKEAFFPILAFISYIIITCMTLEPFSAGRLTYFGFYLMILVVANSFKRKPTRIL